MDEKVLETTMNEGAVVETTNEMPVEVNAVKGNNLKNLAIGTAVIAGAVGLFFLVKNFIVKPIKAKKAAKTEATEEVVETSEEAK